MLENGEGGEDTPPQVGRWARVFGSTVGSYLKAQVMTREMTIALVLLAGLAASTVAADQTVQDRIGQLFGTRDANRLLVIAFGLSTAGYFGGVLWGADRLRRKRVHYAGLWLAGVATIVGLVGMLPSVPALQTVQQLDLHRLDNQAQAALQWGAFWTVAVLLLLVYTGPRLNLGHGVLAWLFGVVSGMIVAGTLPEETAPPLALLPVGAVWAAVVYIGAVYGPRTSTAEQGRQEPNEPAPDSNRSAAPPTRAVWASVALVLLALGMAEFASFVTLDRQVNADHTVTRQAVEDILGKLDQVDHNVAAVSIALRQRGEPNSAYQDTQASIAGVYDLVATAIDANDLTGRPLVSLVSDGQQTAPLSPAQAAAAARAQRAAAALQRLRKAGDALYQLLPGFTMDTLQNPEQLNRLLNQQVRSAIDTTRREARLTREILIGADLPTAGVFIWVAAMFAALVLLPWVLFVLFLLQKRESRAREVLIDLCHLDGVPPPPRDLEAPFGEITGGCLLDRVLGEGFQRRSGSNGDVPTVRQVQSALVDRAFNEQEYLVGLAVLTVIVAAGWYSVFYPRGGGGLAETISQGADAWQLWGYLRSGLTPLTAGFAGGFFWCVYALVRRYLDSDLYPAGFLQCAVQLVLGFVVSMIISIAVPPVAELAGGASGVVATSASGLGSRAALMFPPAPASLTPTAATDTQTAAQGAPVAPLPTPVSPSTVEAITILFAFVGGVSISAGFTQILGLLRILVSWMRFTPQSPLADQARLTDLQGIDVWTEARLAEEGIENVQALAHAPLQRLVLRTHFTTQRLVDWVDQALLYVHCANLPAKADQTSNGSEPGANDFFLALRNAGIRNATALLAAGGWLTSAATVDLNMPGERARYLQVALGRVLTGQPRWAAPTVFTVCQAVIESPNWVYVANYRRANRGLLSAETRAWLKKKNPPLAPLPDDPEPTLHPIGTNGALASTGAVPAG